MVGRITGRASIVVVAITLGAAAAPPPKSFPTGLEALRAGLDAQNNVRGHGAMVVPAGLADALSNVAKAHLGDILRSKFWKEAAPAPAPVAGVSISPVSAPSAPWAYGATSSASTPAPLPVRRSPGPKPRPLVIRRVPRPPPCAPPPANLTHGDVRMVLAPFRPPGAVGAAVATKDGGKAWPLDDGGWAFQYPDMAVRMGLDGSTRIVWNKTPYSIEYDESGISYHSGDTVVHKDANGDVMYHQPTGTMHQEGSTIVYHWCTPNVIIYQTPSGIIYYDDKGMTYRGRSGTVHYGATGQVLYQGLGGITKQNPDGSLTHWTDSGVIYRHEDSSLTYTPIGKNESEPLPLAPLGTDPFPGPALSMQQVLEMSRPPPLPAPSPAPVPAAVAPLAVAAAPPSAAATSPAYNALPPLQMVPVGSAPAMA